MNCFERRKLWWMRESEDLMLQVMEDLEGVDVHETLHTVGLSLKRYSVPRRRLGKQSHLVYVVGKSFWENCDFVVYGFLVFPSRLSLIFYLRYVWLDLVRRTHEPDDEDTLQETTARVNEAINLAKEGDEYIPDEMINQIFRGIEDLTNKSVEFFRHFAVADSAAVVEELKDDIDSIREKMPEVELLLIPGYDADNPFHVQLFESWLAAWTERE